MKLFHRLCVLAIVALLGDCARALNAPGSVDGRASEGVVDAGTVPFLRELPADGGVAAAGQKKVIYLGWVYPTTQYFKAHVPSLDKLPIDGSAIDVLINRAKGWSPGNTLGRNILSETRYDMNGPSFVAAAAEMAESRPTRFKYNFFHVSTGYDFQDPKRTFSWFDDNRWATASNNWTVLANIAYQAGSRGFIVDVEAYSDVIRVFNLAAQRTADVARGVVKDDAAYKAMAKQRGVDLMQTIVKVFPNPEFLLCWGETAALKNKGKDKYTGMDWNKWADNFSLLPAFLEGMRMAATKGNGTHFIDGYEFSYYYEAAIDFDAGLQDIRNAVKTSGLITSPALYDEFVRAGFGIYLDYPIIGSKLPTWDPKNRHNSAAQIETLLRAALAKADQYTWLYSEAAVFFEPKATIESEYLNAIWKAKGETPPAP